MYFAFLRPWNSIIGLAGIAASIGVGFASASSSNSRPPPPESPKSVFKIAVIGSGIGGSSAAYFIRNLFGQDASIDVFEKATKIGGRIGVVDIDGNVVEAGGSVIHDSNRYMAQFCEMGGFGQIRDDGDSTIGIYDGKEFLYVSTGYSMLDKIKLFFRYGMGLLKMNSFTSETVKKFENIYSLQDEGQSFETVYEFLHTLGGGTLLNLTKSSAREVLSGKGISDKIIDELATAVTRCNYGQDMNVNAFTGFVSLAGAQSSKLWAVKGGNYQVCKFALEASDANVILDARVTAISKQKMGGNTLKYAVLTDGSDANDIYEGRDAKYEYDAVVVAVPLEVKSDRVECRACASWPHEEEMRHYQRTIATFVTGKLNHTAFGFNSESELPNDIFTTESPDVSFSSVGRQSDIEGKSIEKDGKYVYKVFSRDRLTEKQLNSLFPDHGPVTVVDWLAYPHYSPPEKFSPFKLDDGVFYVNAIERVASAMEMGAIGGRNAALLTARYLKNREQTERANSLNDVVKGEL